MTGLQVDALYALIVLAVAAYLCHQWIQDRNERHKN